MRPDAPEAEPPAESAAPVPATVIVGHVLGPHGALGELKVRPLSEDPDRFARLRRVVLGGREYEIVSARRQGERVLLRLGGVSTPEQATRLRGEALSVPVAEALPPPADGYYHYQLVGLEVATTGGERLGTLEEVLELPANDVYVVRGERGEVLVPATREVIRGVDLAAGRMTIEAVPGLLTEDRAR